MNILLKNTNTMKSTDILRTLRCFGSDGEHREVVLLFDKGGVKPLHGQFSADDGEELIAALTKHSENWQGAYLALNPTTLRDRVCSLKEGCRSREAHIIKYTHLAIDIDRTAKTRGEGNASDSELAGSLAKIECIRAYLSEKGFPTPLLACSGNGHHLIYRVDLSRDDGQGIVSGVLRHLSNRFSDENHKVDTALSDPVRIIKLYGTITRKSEPQNGRPQRMSYIIDAPEVLETVSREALLALCDTVPVAKIDATAKTIEREIAGLVWDTDEDIATAIMYLRGVEPAIEGSTHCGREDIGGDRHTYNVACTMGDYGISEEKCLDIMLEHFNNRCIPPWEEWQLAAKVSSAYRNPNRQTPFGSKSSQYLMGLFPKRETESREEQVVQKKGGRPSFNAHRFAKIFLNENELVGRLKFYRKGWYIYLGNHWREIDTDEITSRVTGFLQRHSESDIAIGRIGNATVNDVILNLKSDEMCALLASKYDTLPCWLPSGESANGWLPMKSATINVRVLADAVAKGEDPPLDAVRPHCPELFCTYGLDYDFDISAECPKFLKYLTEAIPVEDARESLQMMAGLSLVADCRYNVCFFLQGEGGTGKSVFTSILTALVGNPNVCTIPLSNFIEKFRVVGLTTHLLNVCSELPAMPDGWRGGAMNAVEGLLKMVTNGEKIPVERKNKDAYSANAIARCVFATNTLPHFADKSNGVWDRVRIIPFTQVFRGTSGQNSDLAGEIIREEMAGVLNWALKGLAKLQSLQQFPECAEGLKIKERHRVGCDHEHDFLSEYVEEELGAFTSSRQLHDTYKSWCFSNGYSACGEGKFADAVRRQFQHVVKKKQRIGKEQPINGYLGIKMTPTTTRPL